MRGDESAVLMSSVLSPVALENVPNDLAAPGPSTSASPPEFCRRRVRPAPPGNRPGNRPKPGVARAMRNHPDKPNPTVTATTRGWEGHQARKAASRVALSERRSCSLARGERLAMGSAEEAAIRRARPPTTTKKRSC